MNAEHVIFGSGPLGRAVAAQLSAQGGTVRLVARHTPAPMDGVEMIAADLTDPAQAIAVAQGAGVLYHCLSANYGHWPQLLPPLMTGFIAAAQAAGARAVYGDNLYSYGPVTGPVQEGLASVLSGRNVRVRTELAGRLLTAAGSEGLAVAIGRASDFYGPEVLQSSLGDRVFPALLGSRPVQFLGDPDLPHTFTFIQDFARALIVLGTREEALGKIWHVPSAPTITPREMVIQAAELAGVEPRFSVAPGLMIRALGLVSPTMRSVAEVLYQVERPWVVDHSRFESAFGARVTPHREALISTLDWYRARAGVPVAAQSRSHQQPTERGVRP